jgi:hypothetical protein
MSQSSDDFDFSSEENHNSDGGKSSDDFESEDSPLPKKNVKEKKSPKKSVAVLDSKKRKVAETSVIQSSNKSSKISETKLTTRESSTTSSSKAISNLGSNKLSSSVGLANGDSMKPQSVPAMVPIVSNGDITRGPPTSSEAEAKKLVIKYMTQQNRPYSAIQIFDNLHQRISKPVLQRVLDSLSSSSDSVIKCKEYGKAKIYFLNQVRIRIYNCID